MKEATAALKLALDLVTMHHTDEGYSEMRASLRQLAKEALAQDEQSSSQEPEMVASMLVEDGRIYFAANILVDGTYDLYTTPPKRPWVGLTDEERSDLVTAHHGWNEYGQAIESILKEKNT